MMTTGVEDTSVDFNADCRVSADCDGKRWVANFRVYGICKDIR